MRIIRCARQQDVPGRYKRRRPKTVWVGPVKPLYSGIIRIRDGDFTLKQSSSDRLLGKLRRPALNSDAKRLCTLAKQFPNYQCCRRLIRRSVVIIGGMVLKLRGNRVARYLYAVDPHDGPILATACYDGSRAALGWATLYQSIFDRNRHAHLGNIRARPIAPLTLPACIST